MNKRIKELITQAGGHWNHGDFNMPSSVEFQEQDIQKFAELIIKECIDIADDYDGVGSIIVSGIKQHFGIEPGVEI